MGKMSWKSMENQRIYGWDIMEYDGGLLIPTQKTKCLVLLWDIFVGKMGRFGRFCGAYTQQYDDLVIGFGLNTGYICPKKGLEYGKC